MGKGGAREAERSALKITYPKVWSYIFMRCKCEERASPPPSTGSSYAPFSSRPPFSLKESVPLCVVETQQSYRSAHLFEMHCQRRLFSRLGNGEIYIYIFFSFFHVCFRGVLLFNISSFLSLGRVLKGYLVLFAFPLSLVSSNQVCH